MAAKRRKGVIGRVRNSFLAGLVVVLPIGLTAWLVWWAVNRVDALVVPWVPTPWRPGEVLDRWLDIGPDTHIPGFGVLLFLVFTVVVGSVAKGLVGRSLLHWGERVVDRMPVVRSLYRGLKQIAETVFTEGNGAFQRACLVEFPRRGTWMIGFVAGDARGEIAERFPRTSSLISVFVPTTPNPTSGFVFWVDESDVRYLDMSIEDAAKLIISAGLVYPPLPAGTERDFVQADFEKETA